jgi:hypothetical protein
VTAVFPPPGAGIGEDHRAEVVAVWHRESSCKRWREVIFSGKQVEEAEEP